MYSSQSPSFSSSSSILSFYSYSFLPIIIIFTTCVFISFLYHIFTNFTHTRDTHTKKKKKKNALHSLYKGHHIQNVGEESLKTTRKSPHTRTYKKRRGLSVCLSFVCTDTPPQRPQNSFTYYIVPTTKNKNEEVRRRLRRRRFR